MADNAKLCTITNNSGKDISLLLLIPTDETGSSNAKPIANGSLEVLKTTSGDTIIKTGASGTITLDHRYSPGSRKSGEVQNYDLIVCDSTWLYPTGLLSISQQTDNAKAGYPSQTITKDNGTAMAQAELFYQTIAAYPNSQLTKDYIAVLQAAKEAADARADGSPQSANAVASSMDDALQSFFKGTTTYNQVTMAHLAAVDAYHNQLPFAWARYKGGFTYFLYGSDGKSSLFAGTLSLKKGGAIDVGKPNGGYACQFTPSVTASDLNKIDVDNSKRIDLTYMNGLFVDDPGAAKPKIALRGSYMLNRTFTMNGDDNSIATIISGGVNGLTCIGLDTPQKSDTSAKPTVAAAISVSDGAVKYWKQLTHPKNMTDWVISIATLVASVALIPALAFAVYRVYRVARYKMTRKEALEKSGIEEIVLAVNNEVAIIRIKWAGSGNAVIPEFGLEMLENVENIETAVVINQTLAMALTSQKYSAQEMLEFSTMLDDATRGKLQSLLSSIKESELTISKCIDETIWKNPNDFPAKIKILQVEYQRFASNQASFETVYKKLNKSLSNEAKEFIDLNMSNASTIFDQMRNAQDEHSEDEVKKDPKIEEEIEPALN